MKTVVLEGFLGDKYGRHWEIAGNSYKHIFGCIGANYPEFRQDLIDYYVAGGGLVILDGNDVVDDIEDLQYEIKADSLVITPIPEGSKSGGAKVLLGALLIASLFIPGSSVLFFGAGFGISGASAASLIAAGGLSAGATFSFAGLAILGLGINLALTGIQQLLAPDPSVDTNEQNYLFAGPQVTVASGNPVPILCGEMIIGGILMSSGVIPGVSSTFGHVGSDYTGGGPIARLVGGLDGGLGGNLTGSTLIGVGGGSGGGGATFDAVVDSGLDGVENDSILYSSTTYSKPWIAKAPRLGVSYIAPVVPHNVPADVEIAHRKAIETDYYKQELLYDEDDVVIGVLPFNALLFKTLDGITLETIVDFGSGSVFGTVNRTLDSLIIEAEADAAYVAALTATFEDSTLTSIASSTGAAEIAGALAATFDDIAFSAAGVSDYIATLTATAADISITAESTFTSAVTEAVVSATLDTIALSTVVSSEYITTLASTLDDATLTSVFNPEFNAALAATFDTVEITSAGTFGTPSRTAPVFQAFSGSTDSATVNKPTGTVEGDLLIGVFFAFSSENNRTVTLPAGWTSISGGTVRTPAAGEYNFAEFAYKIAGPSEPSTYSHSISGGSYRCAMLARMSSFDATDPVADYVLGSGGPNGTRTSPAATADFANSHLLVMSLGVYGVITSTPSGMTERVSVDSGINKLYEQPIASAGSIATKDHTQSTPVDPHTWMVASVVINGAP